MGGLCSLTVLLPPLPLIISMGLSLLEATAIMLLVLVPANWRLVVKGTLTLFAISFLYCGIMTAVLSLLSPKNLTVRNSVVYIGISPLLLIVLTLLCYGVFRLYYSLKSGRSAVPPACQVTVRDGDQTYTLQGIIDTGHWLHEPFSGDCVIIGRKDLLKNAPTTEDILKGNVPSDSKTFRLIPYTAVGGQGLLPAFRPSEITVVLKNRNIKVNAFLALSGEPHFGEGYDCIVPAELIRKGC